MIREIEPAELAAAARDTWLILDVREDWERDIASIEGTLNVPLAELVEREAGLPKDKPIAVLCHSGMRSARATAFLNNSGRDEVYNIAGGIDRWSNDVDPSIPRY